MSPPAFAYREAEPLKTRSTIISLKNGDLTVSFPDFDANALVDDLAPLIAKMLWAKAQEARSGKSPGSRRFHSGSYPGKIAALPEE